MEKRLSLIHRLKELGVYGDLKNRLRPFGASFEEVEARNRTPHIAKARRYMMAYLKCKFDWSFAAIGRFFDRDHTTVIAALPPEYLKTVANELAREDRVEALRKSASGG